MKQCKIIILIITILSGFACLQVHAQTSTLDSPTSTIKNGNYDVTILGSTKFRNDFHLGQLVFLADKKRFATHDGNMVKFWDIETGRELAYFESKWFIDDFAISDNNQYMVSIYYDRSDRKTCIDYWDLNTEKFIQTIDCASTLSDNSISISPDGLTAATTIRSITIPDDKQHVAIWDLDKGKLIRFVSPPEPDLVNFSLSFTRLYPWEVFICLIILEIILTSMILLGSKTLEKKIKRLLIGNAILISLLVMPALGFAVWQNKTESYFFGNQQGYNVDQIFSPDSKALVTIDTGQNVLLWDIKTGLIKQRFWGTGYIFNFSNDGKKLDIMGYDHINEREGVTTFDLETHKTTYREYDINNLGGLVGFSKNLKYGILVHSEPAMYSLYNLQEQKIMETLPKRQAGGIFYISNDGSFVIIDNPLTSSIPFIYSLANKELNHQPEGHTSRIMDLTFAPDNNTIHSASRKDSTVRHWDLKNKTHQVDQVDLPYKLSHDGTLVTSPRGKGIYNTQTAERVAKIITSRQVTEFSPDDSLLATCSKAYKDDPPGYPYAITVFNIATATPLASFEQHTKGIVFLDFMPDSKSIISIDKDSKLFIWNATTLEIKAELTISLIETTGATLSPDGKHLVVSGYQGKLKYTQKTIPQKPYFDKNKKGKPNTTYYNKEIKRESTLCIVDLANTNTQKIFKSSWVFSYYDNEWNTTSIKDMKIFPDNKTMIISLTDRTLKTIDLTTGTILESIHHRITDDVSAAGTVANKIVIMPDGTSFITGNTNGTITIYKKKK